MGVQKGIISEPWSQEYRERLRAMIADGFSSKGVAGALGRTPGAVQSMANKLGLKTWSSIPIRTREAVEEHAKMGWASSRIAKRFDVPIKAVDHWTGRTAP